MANEPKTPKSNRNKSVLLKKLSAGKTLCSEVNTAASNSKLLQQRRHQVFVSQLESAKNSMLVENLHAQRDMQRRLDVYKRRKRSIFRDRVMSHQRDDSDDDESAVTQEPSGRTSFSAASRSSLGKISMYSVNVNPNSSRGARGSTSSGMFPAILRVPMVASEDENIQSAIQRQFQQHMRRQESLHAQILRSRVHDFCSDLAHVHDARHSFYVTAGTVSRRRIAFSEGVKSAKGKRLPSGKVKTALSVA